MATLPTGQRTPTNVPGGVGELGGFNFDQNGIFGPLNGEFPNAIQGMPGLVSAKGAPGKSIAQSSVPFFEQLVPGLGASIPEGFAGFDTDNRANIFNMLGGIFANDPGGLPGGAASSIFGAAQNMTAQQAANQQQMNDLALQMLGGTVAGIQGGSQVSGATGLSDMLAQNPFVTSGEGLQSEIEGLLTRRLGQAGEASQQSLGASQAARGVQGGEAGSLQRGQDVRTRGALADALAESRIGQAERSQQDIQNAIGSFGQVGEILNQNVLQPQALLNEGLTNRFNNPFFNSFIEQTQNIGQKALEDELREGLLDFAKENRAIGMGMDITSMIASFFN